MAKLAILCDLDGTLCNIDHRLHYVTGAHKNWGAFYSEIPNDSVNAPVLRILENLLYANDGKVDEDFVTCIFVSGRSEETREDTINWLKDKANFLYSTEYELYMRKSGDFRPDYIIKEEILHQIKSDGYEVLFAIDDRPSVISMWEKNGIFVFKVGSHWNDLFESKTKGVLTLMVGPTGAGKSTWLKDNSYKTGPFKVTPQKIISSDELRQEICGNFRDQTQNDRVFHTLHHLAKARISAGLDCIVDATNLRRSDRRRIIETSGAEKIRYIVINRPMEEKIKDAGWRIEITGLLEKHEQRFNSGLKDILSGDSNPNCEVINLIRK
jgi:AAA domain/HAD superfamily, subfamily IIIB (Acid phosphatase)